MGAFEELQPCPMDGITVLVTGEGARARLGISSGTSAGPHPSSSGSMFRMVPAVASLLPEFEQGQQISKQQHFEGFSRTTSALFLLASPSCTWTVSNFLKSLDQNIKSLKI